jgi:hypothetical protein
MNYRARPRATLSKLFHKSRFCLVSINQSIIHSFIQGDLSFSESKDSLSEDNVKLVGGDFIEGVLWLRWW